LSIRRWPTQAGWTMRFETTWNAGAISSISSVRKRSPRWSRSCVRTTRGWSRRTSSISD